MKPPTIDNQTKLDGRVVSGIVRWVFRYLDLDGASVLVRIKHSKNCYAGRFYPDPHESWGWIYDANLDGVRKVRPNVPASVDHLLICRVGDPDSFPRMNYVYPRKDSPGNWELADWREALVAITAHEAMHLRQYRMKPKGHGRYSEVETEWAAFRLWREWKETRSASTPSR